MADDHENGCKHPDCPWQIPHQALVEVRFFSRDLVYDKQALAELTERPTKPGFKEWFVHTPNDQNANCHLQITLFDQEVKSDCRKKGDHEGINKIGKNPTKKGGGLIRSGLVWHWRVVCFERERPGVDFSSKAVPEYKLNGSTRVLEVEPFAGKHL